MKIQKPKKGKKESKKNTMEMKEREKSLNIKKHK